MNNNPAFARVRNVDVGVRFDVMDTSAASGNVSAETNITPFLGKLSNVYNRATEISECYASLEADAWHLNGKYLVMDDANSGEVGVWSGEVSGASGTFDVQPTMKFTFNTAISTLGWTFHFDAKAGEYPTRIGYTTFSSTGEVLASGTFEADSADYAGYHYAADYYSVEFTFDGTSSPYRRLRVAEIEFGITKSYNRNSVGKVTLKYGVSPSSDALPTRELTFTLDNSDKTYNLLNPDGVYQYLQEGQELTAKIIIDGVSYDMGRFYFTSATVDSTGIIPTITANDRVYALDGRTFDGGEDTVTTLSAAISEVLSGYDIAVYYRGSAADRIVSMAIPQGTVVREAVRYLAQAARCAVWIDRDGVMRFCSIAPADTGNEDGYITPDELYDYGGVTIGEAVDGVRLSVKNEYRAKEDGNVGVMLSYTSGSGENIKSVSNPCVADSEGQAVADWLLGIYKWRKFYKVKNRCDPAVQIGDTINITDIFNNRENALITGIDISYDGGLSAVTEGVGI